MKVEPVPVAPSLALPLKRVYFYDYEFVDGGDKPFGIDFISGAIVPLDETEPEYYGVSSEFNEAAAIKSVPWLEKNVISKLPPPDLRKPVSQIGAEIVSFIQPAHEVEFWAKNGTYDNFSFCQLFGGMNAMYGSLAKKGIKYVTFRDLHELFRAAGDVSLPEMPAGTAHDALHDARWDRTLYKIMRETLESEGRAGRLFEPRKPPSPPAPKT